IALWDDELTQLACKGYVDAGTDIGVVYTGLTIGETYYISVDNHSNSSYKGTFSLCVSDEIGYDFKEGAYTLEDLDNWCSDDRAFTTRDATQDQSKGSCWTNGPNYNRWFTFTAGTDNIELLVKIGGDEGNMRYPFVALWDEDLTQLECESYIDATRDIGFAYEGLTEGETYYISVDNHSTSSYVGTFSLCVSEEFTYDYIDGAVELEDIDGWESEEAGFSTETATGDGEQPSAWGTGPNYNRWFKFQATTEEIEINLKVGGSEGSMRYPLLALWEVTEDKSTALREVASEQYTSSTSDLTIEETTLTVGRWYYISVDNHSTETYKGTFTLDVDSRESLLPVELLDFNVVRNEMDAIISWSTASELNNEYFEVQRSTNGNDFEVIANIQGAGNSNNRLDYSVEDPDIPDGTLYYRLRQVDFDGAFEYSEIVVLTQLMSNSECELVVKPNPCIGQCNINFESCDAEEYQEVIFSVYDALGNAVYSSVPQTISGGKAFFSFDAANYLKPAVYIIRGSGTQSPVDDKKVIINK
ncbi:MAG: hypothetical protein KJ607_11485, partial [Bacteroidetes bacterium]|nr:hypothetical protein [Bacteroidota bacterium]